MGAAQTILPSARCVISKIEGAISPTQLKTRFLTSLLVARVAGPPDRLPPRVPLFPRVAPPTEVVGEPVDRHDLAERSARCAAVDTFDKIEPARMHLGLRLGAHPAHDFFGIGQEGEDGGGWRCDMGLAPDHERFSHRSFP